MTALRVAAVAIAIVAVIDPAITTSRTSRPLVSLLTADTIKDAGLADRVERVLSRQFTVVRGSMSAASGTVLVGDEVPNTEMVEPLTVVMPTHQSPFLRILSLDVPSTPSLNTQVPIVPTLQARGVSGRTGDVSIRVGEARFDNKLMPTDGDSLEIRAEFPVVPPTSGVSLLRVRVQIEGADVTDEATTAIDVRDKRLEVLFFDPRASWLSTFVRRAIERDTRFAVTHRVVTSRGVSNTAGSAPQSLRDAPSLGEFSTIVIGSPEQLSDADVSGLESFMRERGGRVVLLMDRRAPGPIDRLTGASGWRAVHLPSATNLLEHLTWGPQLGGPSIRAQEIAWPTTLPAGARMHNVSDARDSTQRPVVWSAPVGAGRLFVSGALDAWQYRDEGQANGSSAFDPYWTSVIADLSASAPPPIEITLANRSLSPGQSTSVKVWIRDAALSKRINPSATVSAVLAGSNDTTNLRLWPDNSRGSLSGTIVAPRTPGLYQIVARSNGERSDAWLVVDATARAASRDEQHLMAAYASSRKGRVIPEADIKDLPRALSSALHSVSRVETWHPMRSPWWIVPFAMLLGAEWWSRRRRGLA